MFDEEFPSGEIPELSDDLVTQLHQRVYTYRRPPSDSWDLSNGMVEGLSTYQE